MDHDGFTVRWCRVDRPRDHPEPDRGWGILHAVGISHKLFNAERHRSTLGLSVQRQGFVLYPCNDHRELVIAHTRPGLHKVYDQYAYADEKRHALELWAARLRSIVTPPPDNVVVLTAARD
jgi:hypothetical protein